MKKLYCSDCGEYLEGGDGQMKDCSCGFIQLEDVECEACGEMVEKLKEVDSCGVMVCENCYFWWMGY